jgi:hypothetical protein
VASNASFNFFSSVVTRAIPFVISHDNIFHKENKEKKKVSFRLIGFISSNFLFISINIFPNISRINLSLANVLIDALVASNASFNSLLFIFP